MLEMKEVLKTRVLVAAIVAGILALGAAGAGAATSAGSHKAATLEKVSLGIFPYYDYMPFVAAKAWGEDKALGLDLKLVWQKVTALEAAAVLRGSLDVGYTCNACIWPLVDKAPNLRLVAGNSDVFRGFALIGRKGAFTTYDEYVKAGKTPEEAQVAVIQELRGKTFALVTASYGGLISSMLARVKMTTKDVKILNFPTDEAAAAAFIRGAADVYTGSLPQETRLLLNMGDKYEAFGPQEVFGLNGLYLGHLIVTSDYLAKNVGTLQKIWALWYRVARVNKANPDAYVRAIRNVINSRTGATTDARETKFILQKFIGFSDIATAKRTLYNPSSPTYWRKVNAAQIAAARKAGIVKSDVTLSKLAGGPRDTIFSGLYNSAELRRFIDRPLTSAER